MVTDLSVWSHARLPLKDDAGCLPLWGHPQVCRVHHALGCWRMDARRNAVSDACVSKLGGGNRSDHVSKNS